MSAETPNSLSIRIRGLRFAYPPTRGSRTVDPKGFSIALDSWTVSRGCRAALHGPSGCGKSTLLDLVAGVLRPSAGYLDVQGECLNELSESALRAHRIRSIGFVFQDYPLVEYLDAEENVLFPYRLNRALRLSDTVRDRARRLLDELGLGSKSRNRPAELSQGERQRVAIARALINQPGLLLADEPTAGLDPEQTVAVMEILEGLCRERALTLLMVTHDVTLLDRFDQVLDVGALSGASST